ncbi:MAG: hypothetical protein WBI02_00140, partial [Tepidanaerobacteraceae bacterium]
PNERIIRNAFERYYLEHETYPVKLEDLEEGYLDEIPDSFEDHYDYKQEDNGKDYSLTPKNTEQGDET